MLAGISRTVHRAATQSYTRHLTPRSVLAGSVVRPVHTRGQHSTGGYQTHRVAVPVVPVPVPVPGVVLGARRPFSTTGPTHHSTDMHEAIPLRAFKQGSTCPPVKKDTLRLYSMRFCPYALRTRLVLSHKNISHETVNINLVDKPDWFLSKNPQGLVPVLEYNDRIVYESVICNDYLDALYPETRLNPTDPYVLARTQILMTHYEPIARGFYRVAFAQTPEDKDKAMERIIKAMRFMEAHLEGDFFGGAEPGMFDFYAYPHLAIFDFIVTHRSERTMSNAMGGYSLPLDAVPRLAAWLTCMKGVPAVVQNTEKPADMMRFLESWMDRQNGINYDAGLAAAKL